MNLSQLSQHRHLLIRLAGTHVSLVNIDAAKTCEVKINLPANKFQQVTGRILRSEKLQDHNTFDAPGKIKPQTFTDASLSGNSLIVKLPPFSVVVLELK